MWKLKGGLLLNIALIGFGKVGKSFVKLLQIKKHLLPKNIKLKYIINKCSEMKSNYFIMSIKNRCTKKNIYRRKKKYKKQIWLQKYCNSATMKIDN